MTNAAFDPDAIAKLSAMRQRYDDEVKKFQEQAVSYNDYQRYGTLFDRNVPLDQKEALIKGKRRYKTKTKKTSATKSKAKKAKAKAGKAAMAP